METLHLINLQKRMNGIKGPGKIGQYILGGFCALLSIVGIFNLFMGQIIAGLFLGGIFGFVTYLIFSSIPKEKKKAAECWQKFTPEELGRIEQDSLVAPMYGANAILTRDAYIEKTANGVVAHPAKDMLWLYGEQTKHTMYGFIPTGKTYAVKCLMRSGEYLTLPSPNAQKNRKEENPMGEDIRFLAGVFRQNYPGMVFGYNPQIQTMAQKNLAEFARLVDAKNTGRN